MRLLCLLFALFNSLSSIDAQTLIGQLKDTTTQQPIQYANIGIVGTHIGTISDVKGHFTISLNTLEATDTLRISMIGYASKSFVVSDLQTEGLQQTIFLKERIHELKEVVVIRAKPFQMGLLKKYGYPIPLYRGAVSKVAFPQQNYRHEIGTRFTNTNAIHLDSVRLNFAACNLEKLTFRLNVYALQGDGRFRNILKQPIYLTLTKAEALNAPVVNLIAHEITLDTDFLVTLENYRQLKTGASYLFANFKKRAQPYPTYYRNSSQSDWVVLQSKKEKPIGLSIVVFGH